MHEWYISWSLISHRTGLHLLLYFVVAVAVALLWAWIQFKIISEIPVKSMGDGPVGETTSLTTGDEAEATSRLNEIFTAIYEGADSFLRAEYAVCFKFVAASCKA